MSANINLNLFMGIGDVIQGQMIVVPGCKRSTGATARFFKRAPLTITVTSLNLIVIINKVMSVFNDNVIDSLKIGVILCSQFL